ncbi:TPA: hypothetical protein IGZ64_001786 [Escherichia coli]|nr:hypothetical protein [Escherichia coli]
MKSIDSSTQITNSFHSFSMKVLDFFIKNFTATNCFIIQFRHSALLFARLHFTR